MTGRYSMGSRPDTWPGPDAVDVIQAAERFEQSEEFAAAVRDWLATSDDAYLWGADEFACTPAYDREFARWVDGQAP
jgi:hypothetical protein